MSEKSADCGCKIAGNQKGGHLLIPCKEHMRLIAAGEDAARSPEPVDGWSPCVVWFTGLSGSGKSTLSGLVERALNSQGRHAALLDGDNVRHGINRDLGFTEADRAENIRRIAEVARLMADAGLIVLVSLISPLRAERQMARRLIGGDRFLEVFVDAPLEVAESRDPKGLYRKARHGEILNFTGIDSPYEPPEAPDLHLETSAASPNDGAEAVLRLLALRRITAWPLQPQPQDAPK